MIRNTIQRALVLEVVQKLQNHATADEVYLEVIKVYPGISKATVYRNLNNLAAEGLIQRKSIPGQADRFDHNCEEHYHIHCSKCGRLFDADMVCMPELTAYIRNTNGFIITGQDVFFTGICPDCQSKDFKG